MAGDGDTEEHTGGMVALVPSPADVERLTVEGGEDAGELHLTLAYLGDDVRDWDEGTRALLLSDAHRLAGQMGPIRARVMGHAVFNPDGGPDGDRDPCAVYLIGDSDRLTPMRAELSEHAAAAQHEPFLPHVTAGYGLESGALNYTGPITFDRLRVALADDVTDIHLAGPERDQPPEPDASDTEEKGDRGVRFEQKRAGDRDDDGIPDANDPTAGGSAPGKSKADDGKGGKKKRRVASEAGEKRYGKPIGTELGTARDEAAKKAQEDPKAREAYQKLLSANPREYREMLDKMSDSELEALSRTAYSFRSSNPQVVQARIAIAGALRRRGKNVDDHGGLGKGGSSKPAASSSSSGSNRSAGVRQGDVSPAEWEALRRQGWKGRAGDGEERLYPPAKSSSGSGKSSSAGPKRSASDPTWVGEEDWQTRRNRRTRLGLQGRGQPPSAKTKRGEGGKTMTLHVYEDGSWAYKTLADDADPIETADGAYVFVESKRTFTAEQRRKAHTLPGTDKFPIETAEDLKAAVNRASTTNEPAEKVWAHIRTQARRLGRMDLVPEKHRKSGEKGAMSDQDWDDLLLFDESADVEVKRTTTKPGKKPKSDDGGESAIGKTKEDGGDSDEWTIKTIGDLAAAVKRAKAIKDPERAAKVRKHIRARAAAIKAPNMIPKDWSGSGDSGGKDKGKGSGKPWEKGVDPDDLEPHDLARWIECKVMSPDPRAAKLREYWAHGAGRAKWRPGTAGDFERLRRHLRKYVPARMLNGLTANIHKLATGKWPGPGKGPGRHKSDPAEQEVKISPELLAEADSLDSEDVGDDDAVTLALDRYADMADELTTEEEYEQALADEIDWELLPDGELERADGLESTDDLNPDAAEEAGREPDPADTVDALEQMFSS